MQRRRWLKLWVCSEIPPGLAAGRALSASKKAVHRLHCSILSNLMSKFKEMMPSPVLFPPSLRRGDGFFCLAQQ